MNKLIVAAMLLALSHAALPQKIVTLWQCYDSAAVATPLSGEGVLYSEMSSLRNQNLASAWLPSLDLNSSFSYQSDVADITKMLGSIPLPPGSLPTIPHEQYRAAFDVSQVLWDGGVTRSARAVEQVVNELNMNCLLYTSPSPRDGLLYRMPSSA